MSKINLKNILTKKSDASALIISLIGELHADVFIEDDSQKILFGKFSDTILNKEPIEVDKEIIGWIKGDNKVVLIALLINTLVQNETEKKKLGKEILTLYQEVNLIFNFSEKLAQAIGHKAIADITLGEARRLIKSDNGIIVLWDEQNSRIEILASSGKSVFNEEKLKSNVDLLLYMSHSGQSEIVGDLSALKKAGLILPEVQSLIYAALKVKHRIMGAIILTNTELVQYSAADLKFLITLALQSSSAVESALLYEKNIREAKEKEEAMRIIYEVTNKFVPHQFIQALGKSVITDVQLGDQVEKIVTVLFSDIRDYTTLSEQMTPEENFAFVSSFNERVGPIIRQHGGFINQYLGDAIMAIFPNNASDALLAAIKMQKEVQEFNKTRASKNKVPIKIGVGLHTGPLIMGITGDHERMDATTIADTVNTASRLESLTKYYKANILLSGASLKNMVNAETFDLRHLGGVQLKGKMESISIYECFNGSDENDVEKKLASLSFFSEAMTDYLNQSFTKAHDKFYRVLELHPEDLTTKLFLNKTDHYLNNGIPHNWTGVEEMHNK
ncbi:MAG TPA: adenylate/guanylate cyclase domain-containing protein [Puia sp.]|nr:adenylate/guanylate cyclase domain-containing protein [Puia sp.]